jgi:hypothetical protein
MCLKVHQIIKDGYGQNSEEEKGSMMKLCGSLWYQWVLTNPS